MYLAVKTMKKKRVGLQLKQPKIFLVAISVLAFLFLGQVLLSPLSAAPGFSVKFVPPSWVASNASDPNLRILDVRQNPGDYFVGHLPNAVNIADNVVRAPKNGLPVQYLEPERLAEKLELAGVTDKSRVLIYSDGANVLGSSAFAYVLERLGFKNEVAILDGGFAGYKDTQPVTKEFPKYASGKLPFQDDPSIRVTLDQLKDLIGKPGVVLIDPRPPRAFQGEENIFTRNGHIPGARNIPWPTFTDADNQHKLKPLSDLEKILADRRIDKSKDIIVTCTTGREATLQYVVLKHLLGYPKVRIYEGSWTEYSQTDLPVETGPEKPI